MISSKWLLEGDNINQQPVQRNHKYNKTTK